MAGQGGKPPQEGPPPSLKEVETMAQSLLAALRRSQQGPAAQNGHTTTHPATPTREMSGMTSTTPIPVPVAAQVNQKLKRQFSSQTIQSLSEMKRGRNRFTKSASVPVKTIDIPICVLPRPTGVTPKPAIELELAQAGLGKRIVAIPEDGKHTEIQSLIEEEFLKLRPLQGRWLLHKGSGGSGQRKLGQVLMDPKGGYTEKILRKASNNGKITLFLVPLQEELDTSPLPFDAPEFDGMPQVPCITCGTTMPLQMMQLHTEQCRPGPKEQSVVVLEDDSAKSEPEDLDSEEQGACPICQREFPISCLERHASVCAEISFYNPMMDTEVPGPSSSSAAPGPSSSSAAPCSSAAASAEVSAPVAAEGWKMAETPQEAMRLYIEDLQRGGSNQPDLLLALNAKDDDEERDSCLISFYKDVRDKRRWTAQFKCRIIGDAAVGVGVARHVLSSAVSKLKLGFQLNLGNAPVTTLFEGQTDHFIPSLSTAVVDSDLFIMAGRVMGHSIIHGGPAVSGLSRAVVGALMGNTELAMSKLCLEDVPEVEHRETMSLLLEEEKWSEEETERVHKLCRKWFCPVPTKEANRLLLFQQLLYHAVLGRTTAQIRDLRRGLKDTGIMPLLVGRPDVAPLVFPPESAVTLTPEDILRSIKWPKSQSTGEDSDSDEEVAPGTMANICAFFRTFVEEASPDTLRDLMKFWVGWEVPQNSLKMEIVRSSGRNHLPTSSTCVMRLRIPDHYTSYQLLKADLMVCLRSVETGFGLV